MIYLSSGTLHCEFIENYGFKAYVEVDKEIINYYRSLIPKYITYQPQKYPPHISVVRYETPDLNVWNKYTKKKEEIDFSYEGTVKFGQMYLWLNCFSKRLEEFRLELGLPVESKYTLPPEGFTKCFHCTIGNMKGLDK